MIRSAGSARARAGLFALATILIVGALLLVRHATTPSDATRVAEDGPAVDVAPSSSETFRPLEGDGSGIGQRTLALVPSVATGPATGGFEHVARGTVLDDAGVPVPQVEVEAGLERAGRRTRLATASSAPDGTFEIRVSVEPDALDREDVRLYARLRRDGFQKDVDRTRLEREGREAELKLTLKRGGTLSGRVLQLDGQPVRTATLELREVTGNPNVAVARTWAHWSLFDLPYERGGRYELRVHAKGVGVATLQDLQLEPGRDPDPITITIRDKDYLVGVLRDRSGKGLPKVRLAAFPEERILDDAKKLASPESGEKALAGERVRFPGVDSDTHGCFRFDGLVPGRYFIVAIAAGDEAPPDQDRTLYSTGEDHIALVR